eukprot:CAMPEP_0181222502 /NCGR_PEP_ID=MMETSP1096-20121128/30001_1 /TAXON_ID=156174 ORGANISM="Chrysochromulina ericina, Strain CCMP281" /NCGR_SAMPLE_ID=MMETSP1096 /ASSEMBLY_ACC=CAM_ASM_000453 /LENGTH=97 /DNA_ID=CAMNT_0023315269 /DNA_START=72 /DNA_END=365 /DNA_ORIENTATION=+
MNCTDKRILMIGLMLARRNVRLICPDQILQERLVDNYIVSIVEQELCARAAAFIGSKYSTWTDTVMGVRSQYAEQGRFAGRSVEAFLFEELFALGVR